MNNKVINLDRVAVIEIVHDTCRLLCTVNPNATIPLQIEEYSEDWTLPLKDAAAQFAEKGFFHTWTDINGTVVGGIYLTDGLTQEEVYEYIGVDRLPLISIQESYLPALIPCLVDGVYIIEALNMDANIKDSSQQPPDNGKCSRRRITVSGHAKVTVTVAFEVDGPISDTEILDSAGKEFGGIRTFPLNGESDKLIGVTGTTETISVDGEPEFDGFFMEV